MATETDDIRADVIASMAEISGEPVAEAEPIAAPDDPANPPIDETPPRSDGRDESGRFKAKEGEERPTLKLKEPANPLTKPVVGELAADGTPAKAAVERIAPPVDWKGGSKVKWERLPSDVQQELKATYEEAAAVRNDLAPLKELIDIYRVDMVRQTGSVAEGMRQMFEYEKMSRDNPVGLIQAVAQARGLDLRALFGGAAAPQTQQPANVNDLVARAVAQHLQPITAQIEQREQHQTLSAIEAFRADPKHPYFNDVVDSMADLIATAKQRGQTMDLETAYTKAVRMDDAIFARVQQDAAETKAAESKRKADAARRATGASLRGSPLPGAVPGATGSGATARDDVLAAFQELAG